MPRLLLFFALCLIGIAVIQADFDLDQLLKDPDAEVQEVTQLLKRHRKRFRINKKEDFTKRLGHFRKWKKSMGDFQKRHKRAKFRLNKFSLMSKEEQKQHFGVVLPQDLNPREKRDAFDNSWSNDVPDSFDFRAHGKVTPVKNQGPCGSCWAFSTAASIESQYLLKLNQSLDLSEQFLVNCNSGAWGCNGGNVVQTMGYVQKNGIPSEACLPYTVANGECTSQCSNEKYSIGGYNHFGYDESAFPGMLYNYGPAVVTMYVPPEFMLYDSGILELPKQECIDKNEGLHAMTIVGYTSEYWIIKNSWDTDWGEDGYVRVKRGIDFCWMTLEVAAPYLNVTSTPSTTTSTRLPPTVTIQTRPTATLPPQTPPTRQIPTNPPTPPTITLPPQTPPTNPPIRPTVTLLPQTPPTRQGPIQPPTAPPSTPCPQGDGVRTMNDGMRTFALQTFNQKRSEVAHGQLQLASGKRLPPGPNIRKLTYNCNIEYYVQHYANTCSMPNADNIHMVLLAFPYAISIKDAVSQVSKYLFTFSNSFNVTHRPGGVQVFAPNSQFAYDEATSIGCSFSNKACFTESTKSVIVCGITPKQPDWAALYTIGCSGCRADDYCTKANYRRCDIQLGLCYP